MFYRRTKSSVMIFIDVTHGNLSVISEYMHMIHVALDTDTHRLWLNKYVQD